MGVNGMDAYGSGSGLVVASWEYYNEPLDSIKR
jgi:hypothetical protein